MFKDEAWVNICGYENNYKISNYGRVYSVKNNSIINGYITKKGYHRVNLYKNGKSHSYAIHRLVALHFIPNPGQKNEVNHINGNKSNNKVENIEWVTTLENTHHAWKNNLATAEKRQKKVYKYDLDGNFIDEYESLQKAAKSIRGFKGTHSNISNCCYEKRNKAYGFLWSFDKKDKIDKYKNKFSKEILCSSRDNNYSRVFDNITDAAKFANKNNIQSAKALINACLRGSLKSAYGYKWKEVK